MYIELPENVKKIIETLENAGFEAYAVGGCIRDSLLGRTPNDWDITTSAQPLETKALFRNTFDTGIQHGTVSVLLDREIYEVTTYRIDGEYEDSRHPKEVTFTSNLKEDLLRRDFTINAMAYNNRTGLVDLYNGVEDLKSGIIRCVGNPYDRFSEDALRIMRAIRFAAQLDYSIDEETKKAMSLLAPNLSKISAERIQTELVKLLISDHPDYIRDAYELGITKVILPEFDVMMETSQNNPHHMYSVGEHSIHVLMGVTNEKAVRLAALLHDCGKPAAKETDVRGVDHFHNHPAIGAVMAQNILKRLKFDNDTISKVYKIVLHHDWTMSAEVKDIRKHVYNIGEECFPDMFSFNRADVKAQSEYKQKEKLSFLDKLETAYNEFRAKGECISLKDLKVKGKDLIEAGIEPGPEIGKQLKNLLDMVLEDPSKNDRDFLLSQIK